MKSATPTGVGSEAVSFPMIASDAGGIGRAGDVPVRRRRPKSGLRKAAPGGSGGEAQRIRLATQIGSKLRGVLYVLDEPSIGLHPRDNNRLLDTLTALRDMGNTVLVVEHDAETIERADYVIDLGPGAGRLGRGTGRKRNSGCNSRQRDR